MSAMTRARAAAAAMCALALGAGTAAGATASEGKTADPGPTTSGNVLVSVRTPEVPPPAIVGEPAATAAAEQERPELLARARELIALVAERHGLRVERTIPELGAMVVDPGERSPAALGRSLEADPLVADARPEPRMRLMYAPNDPGFRMADPNAPGGDFFNWPLRRYRAPRAWDLSKGAGGTVAIIDTGVHVAHPDLAGRVARRVDCVVDPCEVGGDVTDIVGHGTHVAGLACGHTDNGLGVASLGFRCKLDVIRTDLTYGSITDSIVSAANRGDDAISMSFGGGTSDPELVDALQYAWSAGSIPVAAGANEPSPSYFDNYPAQWVQRQGSGPNIEAGRGLVVTMAKHDGTRNSSGQKNSGVSVAAFGSATDSLSGGQQGILSTWPPPVVQDDTLLVRTTLQGDTRYAYLVGTSMATPQVSGLVALVRAARPKLSAARVVWLIKLTANGRGEYGRGLGWGIIDALGAVAAALDRDVTPPVSHVRSVRVARSGAAAAARPAVNLRLKRFDPRRPAMPTSGVRSVNVLVSVNGGPFKRLRKTTKRQVRFRARRGRSYSFYTRAVDRAGNREASPAGEDATLRL